MHFHAGEGDTSTAGAVRESFSLRCFPLLPIDHGVPSVPSKAPFLLGARWGWFFLFGFWFFGPGIIDKSRVVGSLGVSPTTSVIPSGDSLGKSEETSLWGWALSVVSQKWIPFPAPTALEKRTRSRARATSPLRTTPAPECTATPPAWRRGAQARDLLESHGLRN